MIKGDLMKSKTENWETPQPLFDRLNRIFGFEIDACADEKNHKCEKYFTVEDDGLSQNWGGVQSVVQSTIRTADLSMGWLRKLLKPLRTETRLS